MDAIGHHARVTLAKLDKGEKLPTKIAYPVQTWAFGDSLAMVHLPGEVVVDYPLRLKKELDGRRLWVTGYANNAPCYIPSERVLKEGGYEGGGAMIYYDVPAPFAPGLEDKIVDAVKEQIGKPFAAKFDPKKTGDALPLSPQQSQAVIKTKPGLARRSGRGGAAGRRPGRHRVRPGRQALGRGDGRLPERQDGQVRAGRPRRVPRRHRRRRHLRQVHRLPRQPPVPDRRAAVAARAC